MSEFRDEWKMNANLQDFDRRSQMESGFSRRRSVKFHPSVPSFPFSAKLVSPSVKVPNNLARNPQQVLGKRKIQVVRNLAQQLNI
jgi:hypothetical protein